MLRSALPFASKVSAVPALGRLQRLAAALSTPAAPAPPAQLTPELASAVELQLATVAEQRRRMPSEERKTAAVLIPLVDCGDDQGLGVLFTLRSSKVSTHKGQVSFPGGHVDDGETAAEAALRELIEEVGDTEVTRSTRVLPVPMGEAYAVTGTHVTPFVAVLDEPLVDCAEQLDPNEREVEEAFTLPLSTLLDPSMQYAETRSWRQGRSDDGPEHHIIVPAFEGGPARVWGLTAFILDEFLQSVLLPALHSLGRTDLQLPERRVLPYEGKRAGTP